MNLTASLVLRQSTQQAHQRLDQESAMQQLMGQDLTPRTYQQILQHLHGCYLTIEDRFARWFWAGNRGPGEWLTPGVFHRTRLIEQDLLELQQLGVGVSEPVRGPEDGSLPVFTRRAEILGMAYVICGSLLGARLIQARLAQTLGPDYASALTFFRAAMLPGMPSWSAVRKSLDTELADPKDLEDAVTAARHTFAHFESWLTVPVAPCMA